MLNVGFRSVWPIHHHFLFLISCSMGTWPLAVLSQRSDVEDVAEASVDESLQLLGVCLCGVPCVRAVKQD
jgi:hypothetical protein